MVTLMGWICVVAIFIVSFTIQSHQKVPSTPTEDSKREAENQLKTQLDLLLEKAPKNDRSRVKYEFDGFMRLFSQYQRNSGPDIDWDKIQTLPPEWMRSYDTLSSPPEEEIRQMLSKLVVVKLNGGLGTTMGCHGPKSAIVVRDDLTFLDLTVRQIEYLNKKYQVSIPLVLMNSFNTDEETQRIVRKYKGLQVEVVTFQQSAYPRIVKDTFMPLAKNLHIQSDLTAWYPPGHGNFYESFKNSGLLQKFVEQGREYTFISNIDNLGATVDLNILQLILGTPPPSRPEFVLELTDKTRADVKGGTLIQYENKLKLLELAEVPKEHVEEFKSIRKFKVFNTNNLWIKLDAISRVLADGSLSMSIIANPKTVGKTPVIQLETAVADAVTCFQRGLGVNVPRNRYLPVKTTSDLLLVMSNLYILDNGNLVINPQKTFPTLPLVTLGREDFSKVDDFLKRFESIPDILDLNDLTVSGDVTFGKGVILKGTVIVIANDGEKINIPSGAVLENKIVTGNLRVLDHAK